MLIVTVRHVRTASVVAFLALLLSWGVPLLGLVSFSDDIANARMWNSLEAVFPLWAVTSWTIAYFLALAVGLVGMFLLWSPARWILAVAVLAQVLLQPFLGLAVFAPFEATFGGVIASIVLWLVVVSFWSPFADPFRGKY
jgi:hypothetical protein